MLLKKLNNLFKMEWKFAHLCLEKDIACLSFYFSKLLRLKYIYQSICRQPWLYNYYYVLSRNWDFKVEVLLKSQMVFTIV